MIRKTKEGEAMAFTNTQRRSASFGVVTSLPDDVIDSLWYIIDHFLKNVFELEEELEFQPVSYTHLTLPTTPYV